MPGSEGSVPMSRASTPSFLPTGRRPGSRQLPGRVFNDPLLAQNLHSTANTTPESSKTIHLRRTISRKTLGFYPIPLVKRIFPPDCPSNPPRPVRCPPQRSARRSAGLNWVEPGWIALNEPERPEHAIARKTLEFAPRAAQGRISPEHLNIRPREPLGDPRVLRRDREAKTNGEGEQEQGAEAKLILINAPIRKSRIR